MSDTEFPMKIGVTLDSKKTLQHFHICQQLSTLYQNKNHDYGDSFHKTYQEFGKIAIAIRLQDKVSRLSALSTKDRRLVTDESIRDTLMDIANYAILGIIEIDNEDHKPIVAPSDYTLDKLDSKEEFTYPDITEDTPMKELMRIHKNFWNYVVEHGHLPLSKSFSGPSPVCQLYKCDDCPIDWPKNDVEKYRCTSYNGLYFKWFNATGGRKTELARQIRDLPWKFEQEKDS